ncbi:MAG: hypothetical protein ACKOBG_11950 [Actinomycetota bacterium]
MKLRRFLLGAGLIAATALGPGSAASAHDPIILTAEQATPDVGPLLLDGMVSFAVYGTLEAPGASRGFRVRFAAGDTFSLSALVPDLPPERDLADSDYPSISVTSPTGARTELEPGPVTTFAEPFSKTNYRRYLTWTAPAEPGTYGVTVTGSVPARFTVSVGVREEFGTAVEDAPNRGVGVGGVQSWYATPPPSVAPTTTPGSSPTTTPAESSAGGVGGNPVLIVVAVVVVAAIAGGVTVTARRRRQSAGRDGDATP